MRWGWEMMDEGGGRKGSISGHRGNRMQGIGKSGKTGGILIYDFR